MEVGIILKVAGIGILVAATCQILSRTGRDDQAMLVSIAGIIIVFLLILDQMRGMISALRSVFGL
ncbi:MAG: stage III sporulation protein AC [Ruminococcus sp.]|nr:stage III sporulation protein AC [Clostridia bacterium]MBQ8906413.1 stage III sporulation protein AC [Ruminococcus sp.]